MDKAAPSVTVATSAMPAELVESAKDDGFRDSFWKAQRMLRERVLLARRWRRRRSIKAGTTSPATGARRFDRAKRNAPSCRRRRKSW